MAVFDTTAVIDLNRRSRVAAHGAIAEVVRGLHSAGERLFTTRFTVAELYSGLELSGGSPAERQFDDAAARRFGVFDGRLRRSGVTIGDMDVLIASVAHAHGQGVVTRNLRDFERIPGIRVIGY